MLTIPENLCKMVRCAIVTTCVVVTCVVVVTYASEQCDLNNDACFSTSDTSSWQFNYVTSKQQYVDLISQGKSGLINPYREKEGLPRRNGSHVGHVEFVKLQDGRTVEVTTKALKPLLMEIPNFLTDYECDHIIKQAKRTSRIPQHADGWDKKIYVPQGERGRSLGPYGRFSAWDKDRSSTINVAEMIFFVHADLAIIMLPKDVHQMFHELKMEKYLNDGVIDKYEFPYLDMLGLEEYVRLLSREHPRFMNRYMEKTWLDTQRGDETVNRIRERVVDVTSLGREFIYGGERLQVAYYGKFGHYHAHLDSESHSLKQMPCCHLKYSKSTRMKCRLCRYISMTMFLNDVEEGGELAFPIADGAAISEKSFFFVLRGNSTTDKYNLSHGCKRSNIIVRAKKGTAIIWYNHQVDQNDGWLGELDLHSVHGDCDVIKGEKWVSNMWIPAPYHADKGLPSEYLIWSDMHQAEYQARN